MIELVYHKINVRTYYFNHTPPDNTKVGLVPVQIVTNITHVHVVPTTTLLNDQDLVCAGCQATQSYAIHIDKSWFGYDFMFPISTGI